MAAPPGVAFTLELGAPLALASIQLQRALAAVRALATPALLFAAHVLGQDQLRVVVPKPHTAAVFKLLRAQQASLGIEVKDVKSHVTLTPLPAAEMEQAATCGLAASLLACGWWQLDESRLLGASALVPSPDGLEQVCASVALRVQAPAATGSKLILLVRAEQVEFCHPASRPGPASLAERSARLAGTQCSLLPDLRPALVERLVPADAATLARLRPLWASYGMPLPAAAPEHLVEVRLDCDPDAPTYLYPPCRVLGRGGLRTLADRHNAQGVQAVLAKLRDDLTATPFKFLGDKLRLAPQAREWFPDGPPPQKGRHQLEETPAPGLAFVSARQLQEEQQAGKGKGSGGGILGAAALALGDAIDVASFQAVGSGAGTQQRQRQRRPHYVVPPKLQAAMDEAKRQLAEAQRPAGAARPATAATPAALQAASAAAKQPLALRQAAAAAAGGGKLAVPVFKKNTAAAAPAMAAPKKPGAAQKRPVVPKPPGTAKRIKGAPAAALPSPGTVPASAPASAAAAGGLDTATAALLGASQAPSHMPAAAAGDTAMAGTVAALPKAPAKPRPKAANVDVAAVTSKVQALAAAGTLGKLTIPELKAYLKSVKQPVGGKKAELEERVRQSLGLAAGAAAGTAPLLDTAVVGV